MFVYRGRLGAVIFVVLFFTGCASTQLNYNTLEISDTIDAILTKQVLANFGRFLANQYAIPSMTTLSTGTFTTTNTITPTLSDPLSNTIATATSVTQAAVTSTTQSITGTSTGRGLTIAATDTYTQNWLTNPIIENHILRRLRALYRYATKPNMTDDQFVCEYAIVTLSAPGGAYTIPCDDRGNVTLDRHGRAINPDPNFIKRPGCVVCEPLGGKTGRLVKNEKLINGWLDVGVFPPGEPADRYFLGIYSGYTLSVKANDVWAFYDFILFVQEATAEQSPSGSSGGGGTGGGGKSPGRQGAVKPAIGIDNRGNATPLITPKNQRE